MSAGSAPAALRSLAALLHAGLPLSGALEAWPEHAAEDLRGELAVAGRRVVLGDTPDGALAAMTSLFGDDAATVAAIARLHSAAGCDGARLFEAAATWIERRSALVTNAAVASAGSKLSGRIVSVLPLMILPLVPAAGASLFDRRGSLLLLGGAALLLSGAAWIRRLLPRPPGRDDVGELAGLVAAAAEAGAHLDSAFRLCATTAGTSLRGELDSCLRRVRLGVTWGTSLARSPDEGLRHMAAVIHRAERLGSPVATALRTFAGQRRVEAEAAFDQAARRAPVLMVLPLTICILPGYVLLAIGPILRGLSLG